MALVADHPIDHMRADRFEAVEAAIREMHSYDVPEILAIEAATGSGDYLKWVSETVVGSHG